MVHRLIDIRQGEHGRTALSFVLLLLVVGAYTVVKAVRDAVFLSRFGLTELSVIAIGLAIAGGFSVALYLKLTRDVSRKWLVCGSYIGTSVSLAALFLAWQVPQLADVLPWALYIWSSLFGAFIVAQFWLLAGDVFDVREAKRTFGVIASGAIIGGVIGGLISQHLAARFGTLSLLLVAAGMLAAASLVAAALWSARPEQHKAAPPTDRRALRSLASLLTQPSYVRVLAGLLLISTTATTLLDWQLKAIAKDMFGSQVDEMAAFFGMLLALVSAAALLLQVLVSGWLLKRLGVGLALAVLPMVLVLGSGAIIGYAALPMSLLAIAGCAKVGEGGLRFAIDKPAMELTWLPVPRALRSRAKAFADTVIDRLGTGLTGVIWLVLVGLGWDHPNRLHLISFVTLGLSLVWLVLVPKVRRAYLAELRTAVGGSTTEMIPVEAALASARLPESIEAALARRDPDELELVLIVAAHSPGALPDLTPALTHEQPVVRRLALDTLAQRADETQREAALACLKDTDHHIREAALRYLLATAKWPLREDPVLSPLLAPDSHLGIDMTASTDRLTVVDRLVRAVVQLHVPKQRVSARARVARLLGLQNAEARAALLPILGAAPPREAALLLRPQLAEDSPKLIEAALCAVGRAGAVELIGELIAMLGDNRWRTLVIDVMRVLGEDASQAVLGMLDAETTTPAARRTAIRFVASECRERAAPAIVPWLTRGHSEVSRCALQALVRLRWSDAVSLSSADLEPMLAIETKAVLRDLLFLGCGSFARLRQTGRVVAKRRVGLETHAIAERAVVAEVVGGPADAQDVGPALRVISGGRGQRRYRRTSEPARGPSPRIVAPPDLLERAVEESVSARLLRIFSLLSLCYPPDDIRAIQLAVMQGHPETATKSLELLDNLLQGDFVPGLLLALEDIGPQAFEQLVGRRLSLSRESQQTLLRRCLRGEDTWLRAVAARVVGVEHHEDLIPELADLEQSGPALAAIADRALDRIKRWRRGQSHSTEEDVPLTLVEKALALKAVDVLKRTSMADLAHLAQVAVEERLNRATVIFEQGDAPDALYVVVRGEVALQTRGESIAKLSAGDAFGSWALFNDDPRSVTATAVQPVTLLKVERQAFLDVLADRVELAQSIFKAMVERIKALTELSQSR